MKDKKHEKNNELTGMTFWPSLASAALMVVNEPWTDDITYSGPTGPVSDS